MIDFRVIFCVGKSFAFYRLQVQNHSPVGVFYVVENPYKFAHFVAVENPDVLETERIYNGKSVDTSFNPPFEAFQPFSDKTVTYRTRKEVHKPPVGFLRSHGRHDFVKRVVVFGYGHSVVVQDDYELLRLFLVGRRRFEVFAVKKRSVAHDVDNVIILFEGISRRAIA